MRQMCSGLQELFSKEALISFDSRHPSLNRGQDSDRRWEADSNYGRKTQVRQWEELSPEQQLGSPESSAMWHCRLSTHPDK